MIGPETYIGHSNMSRDIEVHLVPFKVSPFTKRVLKRSYLDSSYGSGTNICGFLDLKKMQTTARDTYGHNVYTQLPVIQSDVINGKNSFFVTNLVLDYIDLDMSDDYVEVPEEPIMTHVKMFECNNEYEVNLISPRPLTLHGFLYISREPKLSLESIHLADFGSINN